MKTSISRFLLLGVASATLALNSGCSPQSSSAESQPAATPVVSAPPVPPAPAPVPEIPVVALKPATMPTNILPTSPLAQVVRLTQAGVDQSIIMVYVTNSSRTFNLDSDKIIYLTDLGLPSDVVTAMMERDLFLQQQFAAAQAELQAQQLQQTQLEQTPPPPEPAPATTAEVMTQPAPVTVNYFNDTLSPYGSWVEVNGYGRCWRPTAVVYNSNWQPYCDRGRWVYTDCGWYWSSDYAWGATFHYGRWFQAANVGWCWYPDTVWAPSWVTWRYSDSYCGWAPLPPQTYCQTGVGLVYQGGNVSVGFGFGLGASCFTFVPTAYFCNSYPRNYCVGPGQVPQIYNNTKIVNNIKIKGDGNNQIIINNGIPVQGVANTTRTPIRPVPVHQIDPAFARGGTGRVPGNHPNFTDSATSTAQSSGPRRNAPAATTPAQHPPRSAVAAGEGTSRPARFEAPTQTRSPQAVNTQSRQIAPGQSRSTPVRTLPERSVPVAAAPQRVAAATYRAPAYNAPVQTARANFNAGPQAAAPRSYARSSEARQNVVAQNRVAAPAVNYSAPAQPQPQPRSFSQPRSYSQPRSEVRQSYSPPAAVAAPQVQRSAPSFASSPAPQSQGGGRMGNQSWGRH